jgi:ribonuclease Z
MNPDTWPMIPHAVMPGTVLEENGLKITAFEADHPPIVPAYGYRFDYKGRSAVVTGDTKYNPRIAEASSGADVVVCEAIARPIVKALEDASRESGNERRAAIMHDIQDYHIAPDEAARLANEAHARLLVLYHLLPAPDGVLARRLFARGIDDVRPGGWTIAEDGSLYTLPIGSDVVEAGTVR